VAHRVNRPEVAPRCRAGCTTRRGTVLYPLDHQQPRLLGVAPAGSRRTSSFSLTVPVMTASRLDPSALPASAACLIPIGARRGVTCSVCGPVGTRGQPVCPPQIQKRSHRERGAPRVDAKKAVDSSTPPSNTRQWHAFNAHAQYNAQDAAIIFDLLQAVAVWCRLGRCPASTSPSHQDGTARVLVGD